MKHWLGIFLVFCSLSVLAQKEGTFGQMEINLPVRLTHTFGISGSMGWNGLVGFGATFQYYVSPHFGFDAGAGLAMTGFKFGGRVRYLFLEKNFTPLVGVGYIYSTGFPDSYFEFEESSGNIFIIELLPSSFIQIVGGVEFVVKNGFFMMATMGYAIQVESNINLISGYPSADSERQMQILYGSGFVMEYGIGFIFPNKKKNKF